VKSSIQGDSDDDDEVVVTPPPPTSTKALVPADEAIVEPPILTKAPVPAKVPKSNTKQDKIAFLKEDNWNKFAYDLRYLDAIASFFHFATRCAAAIEYRDKIYISYNSKSEEKPYSKLLKICDLTLKRVANEKSHFEKSQDSILGLYLLNCGFLEFVKEGARICKSQKIESADTLQDFEVARRDAMKTLEITGICDIDISSITKKLTDQYFKVLECVNSDITLSAHKESYFRPLQDSLKLHHCITSGMVPYKEVIILDNPRSLHAEYNISTHFPFIELLDKNYIGVSKLCCGYCHAYLSGAGHEHRGTHGMCDKWIPLPGQGERIKELVDKDTWQQEKPNQQKRLSWDEFEAEIRVLGTTTLYDYKSSLSLTGDALESGGHDSVSN